MTPAGQILVVDDEAGIRELLQEILQDEGYFVKLAENASEARLLRQETRPDLVLLDIWMPDCDGITLLKEWASGGALTMPVVMMSGHGTIDTAVEATRLGAFDFLEKPIALQKLLNTVDRALRKSVPPPVASMALANLGKCAVVTELRRRLEQVVNLRTPVLFISEPGAGAELCARFLHQPHTPWLCPEDSIKLAENPLDLAQEAKDGVLFLSSIDKLNRLEQKGLALLIGRAERFNARIVCVAPKAVFQYAEQGLFDADLLYALGGLTIPVPALREHSEDVPDLANLLLVKCIENAALPLRHFSMSALNLLRQYDWPGNLMQLDSVVRTLALTSLTEEIGVEEVKRVMSRYEVLRISPVRDVSLDTPLREARDAFERLYFEHQIAKAEGNMSRVAENVGLERTHLYRKLKQLGVKLSKREE